MNSVVFHPNGRYLLSASNDSTIKIWDLRQGHILYTLYGHEGASTAVNFSPCGDYFCSAGVDSVVMVWKSNLNENEQELIEDLGQTASSAVGPTPGLTGGITPNPGEFCSPAQRKIQICSPACSPAPLWLSIAFHAPPCTVSP